MLMFCTPLFFLTTQAQPAACRFSDTNDLSLPHELRRHSPYPGKTAPLIYLIVSSYTAQSDSDEPYTPMQAHLLSLLPLNRIQSDPGLVFLAVDLSLTHMLPPDCSGVHFNTLSHFGGPL